MKIVGTNINFVLLDIKSVKEKNELILTLSNVSYFPRELKPNEYKKFKLTVYGIEKLSLAKESISEFLNDYIDIEQTENKTLEFWSDQHKIGVFGFENFKEEVAELDKADWIENYKQALKIYYRDYDQQTKLSRLENEFLSKLENLIKDEVKKSDKKLEFFNENSSKTESITDKLNLLKRLENIKTEYLTKCKNVE
tara:strand:- start:879 stop:1466 length:588 start_codon:yes stop_codon:yes gene_type:complete